MNRIAVIDNYDSFTYNLVHILRELGHEDKMSIMRNDQFDLDYISKFDHILLSPGPGIPRDAGLMPQVIEKYASSKNILGVCLGHQSIGEVFGSELYNLPQVYHGVVTPVEVIVDDELFRGIPKSFNACRYHSWVIKKDTVGKDLEITSVAENGNIMSIRHKEYCVRGVQFHPESIMTKYGKKLIENWLAL
ncbi:MAG: aminodeoxychorismate/anthranilate synthase component II [Cyclobacteriaceae bacterium]